VGLPAVTAYATLVTGNPHVNAVVDEMKEGLARLIPAS
jgi:hypothetical protein